MRRPDFALKSIYSNGPATIQHDDGTTETKATPCTKCDGEIVAGDWIAKVYGQWQHRRCAVATLTEASASTAWTVLALDAARRPRDYRTAELRQILTSVVNLALGAEREEHRAYVEALTFAYEKRVEDSLGELVGSLDPTKFARRWAEFDWPDGDWDEQRLSLEQAYELAWEDSIRETREQQEVGPRVSLEEGTLSTAANIGLGKSRATLDALRSDFHRSPETAGLIAAWESAIATLEALAGPPVADRRIEKPAGGDGHDD